MRLLSERRSLQSQPLTSASLADWLAGPPTTSGVRLGPVDAIGLTAVRRCVELIAGAVAGAPVRVWRLRGEPPVREPVRSILFEDPCRAATPFELWEQVATHLLLWGNAYLALERDGLGLVRYVAPIHPDLVAVQVIPPTESNPSGRQYQVGEAVYGPADVLHIPALSTDGVVGLSPIATARQALGVASASERTAGSMFGSGMTLSGVLSADRELTDEQAASVRRGFEARATGLSNAGRVAVADFGVTWTPVGMPARDAQFVEARQFGVREVGRLFGVPTALLNEEGGSMWGAGVESLMRGLVRFTVAPWAARIDQRASRLVPRGQTVERDLTMIQRPSDKERYETYAIAVGAGILTADEVRLDDHRPPLPGQRERDDGT